MKLTIVTFLVFCLLSPGLAYGQFQALCLPRDVLVESLKTRYAEDQVGAGLLWQGVVLEIWAVDKGETFSALLSFPSGVSCLVANGEGWSTKEKGEKR